MSKADYKRTIERLIGEVWNKKNLDILYEVFTEDAVMHRGGPGDRGGEEMQGHALRRHRDLPDGRQPDRGSLGPFECRETDRGAPGGMRP